MTIDGNTDLMAVLDGLGQGVLLFGSDGRLVLHNLMTKTLLGNDVSVIKNEGWQAAAVLFNTRLKNPEETLDALRAKALESSRPLRFQIYRSGEYMPCWMGTVQGEGGEIYTMITLQVSDWSAMTTLMDKFRGEFKEAVDSTQGHIEIIMQTMKSYTPKMPVEKLTRNIGNFARLIDIHMERVGRLMDMLHRLEDIRTGSLRDIARDKRKKIGLENFFEDFLEELDEIVLVDPETDASDHRARIKTDIPKKLAVNATHSILTRVLRDILRNAIMYSMKATPVKVSAVQEGQSVIIHITDEGYGVREKERDRVFEMFQRARQPQIISEFGYGLSLFLCKHEVEVMNGKLWFDSEEGIGTTFHLQLPLYVDESSSESSK